MTNSITNTSGSSTSVSSLGSGYSSSTVASSAPSLTGTTFYKQAERKAKRSAQTTANVDNILSGTRALRSPKEAPVDAYADNVLADTVALRSQQPQKSLRAKATGAVKACVGACAGLLGAAVGSTFKTMAAAIKALKGQLFGTPESKELKLLGALEVAPAPTKPLSAENEAKMFGNCLALPEQTSFKLSAAGKEAKEQAKASNSLKVPESKGFLAIQEAIRILNEEATVGNV